MTVLTNGPKFLSSTARLPLNSLSTNRDLELKYEYIKDKYFSGQARKSNLSDPKAMDWSCRSHSPPWSQMGQSRGWLTSKNSITPSLAFLVKSEFVLILHPFITGIAQAATGFADFSTFQSKHDDKNLIWVLKWLWVFVPQLNTFDSFQQWTAFRDNKTLEFRLQPWRQPEKQIFVKFYHHHRKRFISSFKITCKTVVPGSTRTFFPSTKHSIFSGAEVAFPRFTEVAAEQTFAGVWDRHTALPKMGSRSIIEPFPATTFKMQSNTTNELHLHLNL